MSYETFKVLYLFILLVLLVVVLVVRHNSKQDTKQVDSSTAFPDKHRFNKETIETKVETMSRVPKMDKLMWRWFITWGCCCVLLIIR